MVDGRLGPGRVHLGHERRRQDAVDAAHRVLRLGHRLRRVHDLAHHHGGERREDDVEQEVREERAEVARRARQQDARRHEHEERRVDGHELRHLRALAQLHVGGGEVAVGHDGLPERPERVDGLLEHLHHGDAAHVLHGGLVHLVERVLVVHHELHGVGVALAVLAAQAAAHHEEHAEGGGEHGDEAHEAHDPVEHEHDDEVGHGRDQRAHEIGDAVRQHALGEPRGPFDDAAQLAGGADGEVAERHLREVLERRLAHVRRRAERGEVRAHERGEVHDETREREGQRPGAVHRGLPRLAPRRGDGHEVAHDEPHAHEHRDGQHGVERRERAARDGQALVGPGELQQPHDGILRS